MTPQDAAVISHLAGKLCEYHKKSGIDRDCGFCSDALLVVKEVYEYVKTSTLPLSIAEKLINGE